VVGGRVFGGGDPSALRACQARIIADVTLAVEQVPEIVTTSGRIASLVPLAPDVVEVTVALRQRTEHLPGQYFQVSFRGFPARCYSPTVPLDQFGDERFVRFHIRRLAGGRVSSALGRTIVNGHPVKLSGPFGSAYLRPSLTNRLVLVSSGTGFAPIWSIADAAMRESYHRELVVVAGARSLESLYMLPALWRLATCPNVTVVPVTSTPHASRVVRTGRPTAYMPPLDADDIVYACGAPAMVEAAKAAAAAAGAACYADPFVPNVDSRDGMLSRTASLLAAAARIARPRASRRLPI
jgi:3-phenylpropionate/trans-cinnamate dioxygenase ferredoxin reductase subunit